jgi:hypothetical protein
VDDDPDAPWLLSSVPRHARLGGFDLHANVAVPAADRTRLETLKSAWADGTRHLIFEPLLGSAACCVW